MFACITTSANEQSTYSIGKLATPNVHSLVAFVMIDVEVITVRNTIRFIHCADLHLDSPFKGLRHIPTKLLEEIQLSTYRAFQRLIDTAIDRNVDFVLIVGDVFDGEQQSMRAHITLKTGFEKLARHNIQVYLSYGNHDFLESHTLPRNYPENVHIFNSSNVTHFPFIKDNQKLANIYGFSYAKREVLVNKVPEYKPTEDESIFHIGTLHGSLGNEKNSEDHAVYAPFQLTELKQSKMDYWALGHIHKREEISHEPPIIYPGNTQGRSRKESGEKGCYFVSLSENQSEFTFLPLQEIRYENEILDMSPVENIYELADVVDRLVERAGDRYGKVFLSLILKNKKEDWSMDRIQELIDITNEKYTDQKNWVYIYKIHHQQEKKGSMEQPGNKFLVELMKQIHNGDERALEELWLHTEGSKWLERPAEEELATIRGEAEELLRNMLQERTGRHAN